MPTYVPEWRKKWYSDRRDFSLKEDEIATRAFISANSDSSRKTAIRSD